MKIIYIVVGFTALGLGITGVFLPILPTVPFLLLASFCFSKGSARFHNWFIRTDLYKNHLEDFEKNRSMTLKGKIGLLALSSTMLAFPIFITKNNYLRFFLVLLVIFKYYYFIFKIKTIKK
ncbi:MAG: YbaN family protein [Leptotrichiaceae bacterium]|nr:YbaN family protein [Leptotrichiaceae bacterium]